MILGACRIPLFVTGILVIGTRLVGPSVERLFASVERDVCKRALTLQRHQTWPVVLVIGMWLVSPTVGRLFPTVEQDSLQKSTDFVAVFAVSKTVDEISSFLQGEKRANRLFCNVAEFLSHRYSEF